MDTNVFFQISALLGITVSIAFVMRLLRQPLLIAYIIAGIISGPMFLNFLSKSGQTFETFSEFGIVLLLFVVGLSLNIGHIKKIGKVSLIAGFTQTFFTATIGTGILLLLDLTFTTAIYLAIALTFSSTIVITKLLSDKKDSETVYGRYTIGLMIVQDVIAIFVMMVITSLHESAGIGREMAEFVGKILILLSFAFLSARYVVPAILKSVAKSGEFLFIFTITWCFGIASLLHWMGFSLEIGAIIAGLTLGSSPYQPAIMSRVKPLRDFFIVIFFVLLGSEMSIASFESSILPGILLSVFILLGNPLILFLTFRSQRFTRRNSFLAGITAAQVSEFGFVLLIVGKQMGHISGTEIEIFTIVALITIITSSYLITYNEQLYRFLLPLFRYFGRDTLQQNEDRPETYDVFVIGYHRIGWKVCEKLTAMNIKYAVIDYNPEAISRLNHHGIPAFFGDVADVEFLDDLHLEKARLIISTIPEPDDQITLMKYIRTKSDKPRIIANLYHNEYLDDLYDAGANYVMMPHLLGGQWISEVLTNHPWTKRTFATLKKEQHKEMKLRFTSGTHDV